jgi:hypothetical protein
MLEIPQQGKRRSLFPSQSRRRKRRDLIISHRTEVVQQRIQGDQPAKAWKHRTTLCSHLACRDDATVASLPLHTPLLADSVDRGRWAAGRELGSS